METTVVTVATRAHYYCCWRTFNWHHNPFFALRD